MPESALQQESVAVGKARTRSGRRLRHRAIVVFLPLATFALLIVAWQLVVRGLDVKPYILPAPSVFMATFFNQFAVLWQECLTTGEEILIGFAIGGGLAIPLALLIVSVRLVELSLYPLLVFLQLIPKIAIAPLLIVWLGLGISSKVLLTATLCFFPILVDSITGFRALDVRVLYLTRSMGASRWQTFRWVRLQAALPYIFSGLKVGLVFAVTGAIVAEFVGSNAGLGYLLLRASSNLDTALMFAVLVALSVMGLVFTYVLSIVEHAAMPWQHKH